MKSLTVRVTDSTYEAFRKRALSGGLSANQLLKIMVYNELGIHPPKRCSQSELIAWLRGK